MGYHRISSRQRAPKLRYPGAAPGSVGPAAFVDGAVAAPAIAAGAVGAVAIAAGSITNVHVAVGADIAGSKLLALSVDSAQLAASAVTGPKLAPSCVDNSKVAVGANIDGAKLLGLSVDSAQLKANSVIGSKVAALAIDGGVHIASNTVTKNQIATHTITSTEISTTANILGSQLDAAAGIASAQITSLAPSKLSAGAIPAATTIDNSNFSGTALALSKLGAGALASTITVDNTNFSGTALALTKLAAGSLASTITVDNSNFSGTALALNKLGTGALASTITINNDNWSGTALTNANLASGISAGKLTGALASTVTIDASSVAISNINASNISSGSLALARLASGALPTGSGAVTITDGNVAAGAAIALSKLGTGALASGITVNNSNWSGTALAVANMATGYATSSLSGTISNSQLASGIDASKLTTGTLPIARIADGAVTAAKLETFLRSGFRYKMSADSALLNSLDKITFGTLVYDALAQRVTDHFIPAASGKWQWNARLRLEGGDIAPGYGISVVVIDVTAGTIIYTSPPRPVFSDYAGSSTSDEPVDVCIAELDAAIAVTAGNSYAVGFDYVKQIHFATSTSTWGAVRGQAVVKADYTNSRVSSVPVGGSYVQVTPIIQ